MQTTTVEAQSTNTKRPDFGKCGRFSAEMERLYEESQKVLGLSEAQAEKFAFQAARDAGNVYAKIERDTKISYGKSNADNKMSIKFAASTAKGGITGTNALNLAHALEWIGNAGKHGVSYGFTKWKLSDVLQEYVDGLVD